MAEENLQEPCARCGHPREMHAVFIDNQVGSRHYVPDRRACQHYSEFEDPESAGTMRKAYDCKCHHFVNTKELEAEEAKSAKVEELAEELAKLKAEKDEKEAVEALSNQKEPCCERDHDGDGNCDVHPEKPVIPDDFDAPMVLVDQKVVDTAMELCMKVVEAKRYDDARKPEVLNEMLELARKAWKGLQAHTSVHEQIPDVSMGTKVAEPEEKCEWREKVEAATLDPELLREAAQKFEDQGKKFGRAQILERQITALAVHITRCFDKREDELVELGRMDIRHLCRELMELRGEITKPQRFNHTYADPDAKVEYDPAKDGPTVTTIDENGEERQPSRKAKKRRSDREKQELEEKALRQEAIDTFTETERSITGVDCTKCGACCCPPPDAGLEGNLYVELTHSDLVRLGSSAGPHLGPSPGKGRSPNTSGYHLRAYKDVDGQVRCPFFVGEVGDELHNCGCGIYEQRPYACQLFPKGSEGCRIARRNHPRINPHLRKLSWGKKSLGVPFDYAEKDARCTSELYNRQAEAADSINMKAEVGEGKKLKHLVHDEFEVEEDTAYEGTASSE